MEGFQYLLEILQKVQIGRVLCRFKKIISMKSDPAISLIFYIQSDSCNSVFHAKIIFTWLPYYIAPILSEHHPFPSRHPHTTDRALMFAFFPKPFEDYKKEFIAHNDFPLRHDLDVNKKQNENSLRILTLQKKRSFSLRISLVNVTKYAGNCRFGHIYCRNP